MEELKEQLLNEIQGFREAGEKYFDVYIGGGLGANPLKAVKLDERVKAEDALYVIEAMVKCFETHGDYERHNKARVRYILERMGEATFKATFKTFLRLI